MIKTHFVKVKIYMYSLTYTLLGGVTSGKRTDRKSRVVCSFLWYDMLYNRLGPKYDKKKLLPQVFTPLFVINFPSPEILEEAMTSPMQRKLFITIPKFFIKQQILLN